MDDLVEMAERLVEETAIAKSGLQEHQLRNLQNLTNATDSVRALENFVCYQMGRHDEWRHNRFGKRLLEDFQAMARIAEEIAPGAARAAHLALLRLYLGFLIRAVVARRPRKEVE
jgi:hypothetical protein